MKASRASAVLAFAATLFGARAAGAAPGATPTQGADLQSPEQRDTRGSAYSLPADTWSFDVSALGVNGADAFARIGMGYGFGSGFELDVNLAHWSVGLLNVAGRFQIVDSKWFALGASLGVWYGHGEWFWIATGLTKELIRNLDVVSVPVAVTASFPVTRSVQFDLGVQYTHAEVFGNWASTDSAYFNAKFGMRQVEARPGARFFLSDATELDVSASLPVYTAVPSSRDQVRSDGRVEDFETVPFSKVWALEAGVRSRLGQRAFGTIRLHYGPLTREIYDASIYPSFDVEFRF